MNKVLTSNDKPTIPPWFLISLLVLFIFSFFRIGYGNVLPMGIYNGQPFSLDTAFIIIGHLFAFGLYPLSLLRKREHTYQTFKTVLFSGIPILLMQSAVRLSSAQLSHIDCGNSCTSGTYFDDLVINSITIGALLVLFGVILWLWRYRRSV